MLKNISDKLQVFYHDKPVGTLVALENGLIGFSYDPSWLAHGFSISPFSLPLTSEFFVPQKKNFGGLFGVFADSLPDSWGSYITSAYLDKEGLGSEKATVLTRLALLNARGLGALTYRLSPKEDEHVFSAYEQARRDCELLYQKPQEAPLDELMRLGGSSGGAHPKIHIKREDGNDWIVKFPGPEEKATCGYEEYAYNLAAKRAGVNVNDFDLVGEKKPRYFASRRFDRKDGERIHMISLGGLYEKGFEDGVLDYGHLFLAVLKLGRDQEQLWEAFRLLCFNVYAHNDDDHAKNFAFLYDENRQAYRLAPAYDLTYVGFEKNHRLTVHHNFYPEESDILALAKQFDLDETKAKAISQDIKAVVTHDLSQYWK